MIFIPFKTRFLTKIQDKPKLVTRINYGVEWRPTSTYQFDPNIATFLKYWIVLILMVVAFTNCCSINMEILDHPQTLFDDPY